MPARPLSAPILDIAHLRIERGRTVILRDVSWRVEPAQHWVILGPNGSGKTSLLRALTAYLTPTAGTIELLGRRYGRTDWRELRKHVGLVTSAVQHLIPAAEPAIETVISGKSAQLDLWGAVTPADRAQARRILHLVGVAPLAEREWLFLSQGERQRVLVGRALMARPRLLIFDEPCAGLDPVAREQFLRFLDQLARRPRAPALVLVTHHLEEIMPAFTHVLVLRAGRVVAAGPMRTVLTAAVLRRAFGGRVRLAGRGGRWQAQFAMRRRGVF
ncbi:MAG: ABC transporter [Verrucomicrobia bacterium RIFCSPLOWO2_12_FULL_64_8]|nr:MAG: ABC transporter [Verrucomicrobia bacterium RIFCSPLOWO2_12_FULL_64_8]